MDPVAALQLEVLFVAAAMLVAVLMLASIRADRRRMAWLIGGLMLVGGLTLAAVAARRTGDRTLARLAVLEEIPRVGRPGDGFVGSDACRACHPGAHASWHDTYHRTMTQVTSPESVTGDFDGVTLENRGRVTQLKRRGDAFHAITPDPDWEMAHHLAGRDPDLMGAPPMVDARVVMSTGSHHYQSYWIPSRNGNRLINFHWAWMHETEQWLPREAAFLRPPDSARLHQVWNNQCIFCHSTDGAEEFAFDDSGGIVFDTSVAELGISCESCHGPGLEHVELNRDPVRRTRLHLAADPHDPSVVNPQKIDSGRSRAVCAQCHSVSMPTIAAGREGRRFLAGELLEETRVLIRGSDDKYHTEAERAAWLAARDYLEQQEPGYFAGRFWPDGMIRVTGVDHSAMIESPCAVDPSFTCLSCHSMHDYASPADMLHPGMDGDAACIGCHSDISADLAAHTLHPVGQQSPSCMDCHMPKTTYGLLKAVRSHEISSPSAAVARATGWPDACSLCHADRTLEWTARELERGWGIAPPAHLSETERTLAAAVRWAIAGDAGQRALVADHLGDPPVRNAAVTDQWALPLLAHLLDDPYDAVRSIAARSYRQLTGLEPADPIAGWTVMAEPEARAAAATARLERHAAEPFDAAGRPAWNSAEGRAAILRLLDGGFDVAAFRALVSQRDDRPIELRE